MLTIKQITENTEAVIRGLEKKHFKNAKETIEQAGITETYLLSSLPTLKFTVPSTKAKRVWSLPIPKKTERSPSTVH